MQLNISSPFALQLSYSQKNESSSRLLLYTECTNTSKTVVSVSSSMCKTNSLQSLSRLSSSISISLERLTISMIQCYWIIVMNQCFQWIFSLNIQGTKSFTQVTLQLYELHHQCNVIGCFCYHFVFSFSNFCYLKLTSFQGVKLFLKEMYSFFFIIRALHFKI